MANDKITMLKLKRMLQLLDAGRSLNDVCKELHMSKRTVHNYKQRAVSSGISISDLRKLDDVQLNVILQPKSQVPLPDERKTELEDNLEKYLQSGRRNTSA